jgi:hypothetical protein
MILNLQYRGNDYLNDTDVYICYDAGIKNLFLSKLHYHNGSWYTNESLRYKAASILIEKIDKYIHKNIYYKGIPYKGTIIKVLTPKNIGIIWDSGPQIKQHGLASFWTDLSNLEIKIN